MTWLTWLVAALVVLLAIVACCMWAIRVWLGEWSKWL